MPYPDGCNFRALDAATRDRPDIAVRDLYAEEIDLIRKAEELRRLVDEMARDVAWVGTRGDTVWDTMRALKMDVPDYCATLIAAIRALPREEADAEEIRQMEME